MSSQRSRSIADVLKTLPVRRSHPSQENREEKSESTEFGTSITDTRESQTEIDNTDIESSRNEPTPQVSVPRSHQNVSKISDIPRPSKSIFSKDEQSSGAEDLVSRLSRLHNTPRDSDKRPKATQDEESDEESHHHRATSRRRSNKRYDSSSESTPKERHHSSHEDNHSEHSEATDDSDRDEPPRPPPRPRGEHFHRRDELEDRRKPTRPRSPRRLSEEERPWTRSFKDEYNDSRRDKPVQRTRPRIPIEEDSEKDSEDSEDRHTERSKVSRRDYDDESIRRSPLNRRSEESSPPISDEAFSTLPKATIIKIAKTIDVGSLASDVYDTIKDLSGIFTHKIISEVSRNQEPITSAELEPIVERYLGRPVEDLENSDINVTTFVRWLKKVMDKYHSVLKKEAILYLHNVIELYIILLFFNAKDFAKRARRSRITSKDLELAARMR